MNIVYLAPYIQPNHYLFAVWLRRAGVDVLGVGDVAYDALRPELRESMAEYYRVDDVRDYDQLLRACGYFIHGYGRLNRVMAHNPALIETEARLRADFNIPGENPRQIGAMTRYSEMRQILGGSRLRVPRTKLIRHPENAKCFARKSGFPVLIRPNRLHSPEPTFRIPDEDTLDRILERRAPDFRRVIEPVIPGRFHSYDGLTDRDGQIVFATAHVYEDPGANQGSGYDVTQPGLFYYSLRLIPAEMERVSREAVAAMNLRERFFHVRILETPEGEWVVVSVVAAPGIGMTLDMINYANNFDIYGEYAHVVTENRFRSAITTPPWHCGYIGRELTRAYAHSHGDIMYRFGSIIACHGPVPASISDRVGSYAYIVNTRTLDEMKAVARFVREITG